MIDPPYRRPRRQSLERCSESRDRISVGWLGNTGKGRFLRFLRAARQIRAVHRDVSFHLVGYLNSQVDEEDLRVLAEAPKQEMLPGEKYEDLLSRLDVAVLWSEASSYEHRISAAFLDALVRGVPGIYMETPFLREFFSRFGACGVLCRSDDELEFQLKSFCAGENPIDSTQWQENLRFAAEQILPKNVAPQLRDRIEAVLPSPRKGSQLGTGAEIDAD